MLPATLLIACGAPIVGPVEEPESVVTAPPPPPAPAPIDDQLGTEPRVTIVGTPYTYNPGYHGSWSRRVLGGRPDQRDEVDVEFDGLPVEGVEQTWRFTLELLELKPSPESGLDLAALPASTVTVHQTENGPEVSSTGLSTDLASIVEPMVSDLFVVTPTTTRGVGGTFVSDVVSAPGRKQVEEHTRWTLTDRPADGVLTLEGKWTRTTHPAPGLPSEGPVNTRGTRTLGLSPKGTYRSTRHSTVHEDGASYVEVVRVGTGRRLH